MQHGTLQTTLNITKFFSVMNHFQKKQQGFDLFDFIFKNQNDAIYCAANNTNFEDVKVLVENL